MSDHHSVVTTPHSRRLRNSSTMFTPYTPGRAQRRMQFDPRSRHTIIDVEAPDAEDNMDDALLDLIKLTWNISAVSPLFGLDFKDDVRLKQYGKRLREEVASSLFKDNVSYEAKFTPLHNLVCSPSDPPAVKVEVHSKDDEKNTEMKQIYLGIFLSWGPRNEVEAENVKLPILLNRGLQGVAHAVHSTLSQMFDCTITAMPASQEDLMWLTTIILNSEVAESRKTRKAAEYELILEYTIPELPPSDLIKVKFPLKTMKTLWSKICPTHTSTTNTNEQVASVIDLSQVNRFFECLRIKMLKSASLELGYCLLEKISLPNFTIKSNKMKATDIDAIDRVLWFFQEKAVLHFQAPIAMRNEEF
ncbi:centromere protein L-like [Diprion similis]|uniref:centromere protein L-like n=1 Tax=Diprion similis TaxID=362088 RepID=UPI001EF76A48|nr:centromere protein L-like [Diprion similis]XP_046744486.1 centromere protein L-like [Diprion similis]XP_046744488.1 centromere protein L-like [Diprion similis]